MASINPNILFTAFAVTVLIGLHYQILQEVKFPAK